MKKGTFLLLEQSKILVYRNLFKKVFLVNEKQTQVKLQLFERALQCLGEPTDLAEVECVVANLIYRGCVKGYISHQKAVLVVSKKDPYPTAAVMKAGGAGPHERAVDLAQRQRHTQIPAALDGGPSRPGRRARRRVR